MISSISRSLFFSLLVSVFLKLDNASAKTQFLYENDEGLPSPSSLSTNYRLSTPKTIQPLNRVPQHLQDIQYDKGASRDVIHIIDPPVFSPISTKTLPTPQHLRHIPKDYANAILDESSLSNYLMAPSNSLKTNRPTSAFLIKPQALTGNIQQELNRHNPNQNKKPPPKLAQLSKTKPISSKPMETLGYHFGTPQFYPLKVTAAVRHNHIIRTRPTPMIPHVKHRVHYKKFKTFQSNIQQKSFDFDEEAQEVQMDSLRNNVTRSKRQTRSRRDTNARHKSGKMMMRGSLLPVALTIMGENGELLTGRALLQHITVLLKNASTFEPNDEPADNDFNKFVIKDVLLNEKEFHRIMDNSMNLTDPVMLTVLGINAMNDSQLLTNAYVNEYLNCIDSSKTSNRFKALQSKIDCMKRKMFDRSNFDSTDSSRYSISNLPAALVYADVMTNIKNLVRPKNGIAYYSLPVDELTHLQQVVLPIEDYVSPAQIHSAQYAPSSYQNRKIFFNENIQPKMSTWYVVKSDGRIYQMESNRGPPHQPPPIFHGFPDIPNADVFTDGPPRLSFFDSLFFDE
ncbi:uncharacterized protein LOC129909383 [Episyrphus balteatus]|uniref:uncharacterized protein LOC129909383 n=1 Tax=Episyrphus balteatus TaxID=286459 RepID=UPI002485D34C|nr:uncharacterized protein LOC129909383 [Episyrphus balteatus]